MSDSDYVHGIRVIKGGGEVRVILTPNQAVVGVVGTAPKAAPELPVETPKVYFKKQDALSAILPDPDAAKTFSERGTLWASVDAIFNQGARTVIVIRAKSNAASDITAAIEKFVEAEALTNFKPKVLCAPGHTANIPESAPTPNVAPTPAPAVRSQETETSTIKANVDRAAIRA